MWTCWTVLQKLSSFFNKIGNNICSKLKHKNNDIFHILFQCTWSFVFHKLICQMLVDLDLKNDSLSLVFPSAVEWDGHLRPRARSFTEAVHLEGVGATLVAVPPEHQESTGSGAGVNTQTCCVHTGKLRSHFTPLVCCGAITLNGLWGIEMVKSRNIFLYVFMITNVTSKLWLSKKLGLTLV